MSAWTTKITVVGLWNLGRLESKTIQGLHRATQPNAFTTDIQVLKM
jgi:hypothetical protein